MLFPTCTVPERLDALLFCSTRISMYPAATLVAMISIQGTSFTTVHATPDGLDEIVKRCVPPWLPKPAAVGHVKKPRVPSWVMEYVSPAIVIVPLRRPRSGLASTE